MKKFSRIILGAVIASMIAVGATVAAPSAYAAPAPINLQSSSCPSIIKQGQSSGCVVELQNLLKKQGYNPGAIDGIFGSGTLAAVKSFQKAKGLTVDGLVGPATKSALYPRPVTLATCPSLSSGSKGECVTLLQKSLNTVIFARLAVDGQFGPATQTAVKDFQASRCIAADGIVGPDTKAYLADNNKSKCPYKMSITSLRWSKVASDKYSQTYDIRVTASLRIQYERFVGNNSCVKTWSSDDRTVSYRCSYWNANGKATATITVYSGVNNALSASKTITLQ